MSKILDYIENNEEKQCFLVIVFPYDLNKKELIDYASRINNGLKVCAGNDFITIFSSEKSINAFAYAKRTAIYREMENAAGLGGRFMILKLDTPSQAFGISNASLWLKKHGLVA